MIVMSWKLWLRRIAVAAAASLVVLALLAAAIEFAVPSRWWTAFLKVQLERELRRPLRLGAARWSLWHGFSAENLWIGELPAQGSGAFLQARVMSARPRLWPLLAGRVSIQSAKLVGVKARVVRDASGRFNFSDLSGGGAAAGAAPAVDIRRLDLQDAELDVVDRGRGFHVAALGLWGSLSRFRPNGKPRLEVDCKVQGVYRERTLALDLSLQAEGRLHGTALRSSSGRLSLKGIRHANFNAEELRVEWELDGLSGDLATAGGRVRLRGSAGRLERVAELTRDSRWADLLLTPVKVLARLRGMGLAEIDPIVYSEILGDYRLSSGEALIQPFAIRGPVLSVETEGAVRLREARMRLTTNVAMGKTVIGALIQGPIESPEITPHLSFRGAKTKL